MIKELGKTIVVGLLVGSLAMPVPAAESAAITTAKSSVKSSVNPIRANGLRLRVIAVTRRLMLIRSARMIRLMTTR